MIVLCYRAAKSYVFPGGDWLIAEIYFKVEPDAEEFRISVRRMPEIKLTEKAEKGRANAELLKELKRITGEKPGLISGHSSRRKKLLFDQSENQVRKKLEKVDRCI